MAGTEIPSSLPIPLSASGWIPPSTPRSHVTTNWHFPHISVHDEPRSFCVGYTVKHQVILAWVAGGVTPLQRGDVSSEWRTLRVSKGQAAEGWDTTPRQAPSSSSMYVCMY